MSELEILYSPSFWCKRNLTPGEVIAHHLDFIEKGIVILYCLKKTKST